MKLKYLLLLLFLPFALASCSFDKDDDPTPNTSKDPAGTIIINFAQSDEWYYVNDDIYFKWKPGFNIRVGDGDIYMIGPVKNIASITKKNIPSSGWGREAAAVVGYGYIITGWRGDYAALYVDSEIKGTNGGVYGYVIKALVLN